MNTSTRLPDTVQTIPAALAYWADLTPDSPALLIPDQPAVTYADLWRDASALSDALQHLGIGRYDRVVLLLPDGPGLATALLGTMCAATAVVLEAMSPAAVFAATLGQLRPAAVLASPELAPTLRACCRERGVPIYELRDDQRGQLAGHRRPPRRPAAGPPPDPDDPAVLRQTSGTTGKPKWLSQAHVNLIGVGRRQRSALSLYPGDRAPAVPPMSQTLGQSVLLHAMLSGSALIVAPASDVASFWERVETEGPTWMSAPAGFLELLARGLRDRPARTAPSSLRFVQVTSAAISPETCDELTRQLGAPILPKYSSTETGTVALTLPPPARSKRGSVGQPVQELRIVDSAGHEVGPSVPGELWTRGRLLFPGYLDDPEATAAALSPDGWFRTGDLGYLDDEGFLFLTGRLNELINRGGQKFAPAEVDDVLLAHPAVCAAAAFAAPDERLGEDIVAAVVVHEGATVKPRELRAWLLDRLSPAKVPRRVWFVDELPLTASGKVRRGELTRRWAEERG